MRKELRAQANSFGRLSKAYQAARGGYPNEVLQYLRRSLPKKGVRILDVGCGTGISTRLLQKNGLNVIGADKDRAMIRYATRNDKIRYVVASATKLPFRDGEFDAVTAFTAFHWFTDRKSVSEIKRVLRKGGVFCVVTNRAARHKRPKGSKSDDSVWEKLVNSYAVGSHNSYKDFYPSKILRKHGFLKVRKHHFLFQEKFTPSRMVLLNKSLSYWNLVPSRKKKELEEKLRKLYTQRVVNGYITRYRDAEVVIGVKPAPVQ